MVADALFLARDRGASQKVIDSAERDRRKVLEVAERIRRMTRIYQERLDGKRTNDA